MRRGWRTAFDRHLVDGLTVDERIAALEGALDAAARRIRLLEELDRRRAASSILARCLWFFIDPGGYR